MFKILKSIDWKSGKNDLKTHWRLFPPIIICMMIGPFISNYFYANISRFFHNQIEFENLWAGSAIGSIIGLFIGYFWQLSSKVRRPMTSGTLLLILGGVCILFGATCIFNPRFETIKANHKKDLIADIRLFLKNDIIEIGIFSLDSSSKTFQYIIRDPSQLQVFRNAALSIDTNPILGHSGRIYECVLLLITSNEQKKLIAKIYNKQKKDLFVTNIFQNIGESEGPDWPVRIPGLGEWIMKLAPEGKIIE